MESLIHPIKCAVVIASFEMRLISPTQLTVLSYIIINRSGTDRPRYRVLSRAEKA